MIKTITWSKFHQRNPQIKPNLVDNKHLINEQTAPSKTNLPATQSHKRIARNSQYGNEIFVKNNVQMKVHLTEFLLSRNVEIRTFFLEQIKTFSWANYSFHTEIQRKLLKHVMMWILCTFHAILLYLGLHGDQFKIIFLTI